MPSIVGTKLNRYYQSIITTTEDAAANHYAAIYLKSEVGQQILIDGMGFGYSINNATDRTNFRIGYANIYENVQLDTSSTTFFSRLGPFPEYGDILYWGQVSNADQMYLYNDFDQPYVIEETRSLLAVCVAPLLSAPSNGSYYINLFLRGRIQYQRGETHFPYILR